jgi:hypothetical protein
LLCLDLPDEGLFKESDSNGVILSLLDTPEKDTMFNPAWTHVGIMCGCNSQYGDMCCFQFGTDVKDKAGIKHKNMIDVPKLNCNSGDDVEGWHAGVSLNIEEKPVEVKKAKPKKGTYKEIT